MILNDTNSLYVGNRPVESIYYRNQNVWSQYPLIESWHTLSREGYYCEYLEFEVCIDKYFELIMESNEDYSHSTVYWNFTDQSDYQKYAPFDLYGNPGNVKEYNKIGGDIDRSLMSRGFACKFDSQLIGSGKRCYASVWTCRGSYYESHIPTCLGAGYNIMYCSIPHEVHGDQSYWLSRINPNDGKMHIFSDGYGFSLYNASGKYATIKFDVMVD